MNSTFPPLARACQLLALALALTLPLVSNWGVGLANAQDVEEGEFTLNLKNTDIHSLIATVAKQTGRNFIVDPRVKAKVTVISAQPMGADELYEVFLSILQVHGFSAVPTGDIIKILPDVTAKQSPIPNLSSGDERDQLVTHVIRVENVAAAQLVPILRPLVPQQGHLAAYPNTNSLVITDRAANIDRLLGIIRRIDLPSNDEIEFVPLQHAVATEVVRILNSLQSGAGAAGQAGAGGGNVPRLAADERTNSVLISGSRDSRLRLRALIASLDTPLESGGNTKVIYLKYANATDLASILLGVSASQEKIGVVSGDSSAGNQNQSQTQPQNATNTQTQSTDAAPRSPNQPTEGGIDIQADEHTNALIITAPPDALRNILAVIRQLDIRRAQVLVEAIIAELSDDNSRSLGLSFAARSQGNPGALGNLGSGLADLAGLAALAEGGAAALPLGTSLLFGDFNGQGQDFGFLVRAIASDAANNILSTPSIVTLDNEEAEIVVGQNVPFITGQTASANNTNPFQTIERQDIGLTLKVRPQINEGNSIKMDIEQEVSSIGSTSQAASDIITNKRSIKTTVLIEDGQTLVLGGLIDETLRDTQERVPLLGDIPILGRLFQFRSTVKTKQNLMVFLHPTILEDRQTADFYSSEKYSYLRSKQIIREDGESIGMLDGEDPLLPDIEVLFKGLRLPVLPNPIASARPAYLDDPADTQAAYSTAINVSADDKFEIIPGTPQQSAELQRTPTTVQTPVQRTQPERSKPILRSETPSTPQTRAVVTPREASQAKTPTAPATTAGTTNAIRPKKTTPPKLTTGGASSPSKVKRPVLVLPEKPSTARSRTPKKTSQPSHKRSDTTRSKASDGVGTTAVIQRVRVGINTERTRLVMDINRSVRGHIKRVFNTDGSVSVTIKNAKLDKGFVAPKAKVGAIKQLVIDQQGNDVFLHLVPADVSAVTYQVLSPSNGYSHRFLIDVKPKAAAESKQE